VGAENGPLTDSRFVIDRRLLNTVGVKAIDFLILLVVNSNFTSVRRCDI
jgi:hypothetical protein